HKVPQSQYFHGLWHSFFFSTVKDGNITKIIACTRIWCQEILQYYNIEGISLEKFILFHKKI
ncbi:hypothetical protein, partial [Blautia obeum]|uniref:hypothetical protein n=1 Tax=Blautia obeum TaxID=40520 RepID=UPI00321C07FD